jgi:hypothetical protein
MPTLTELLDRQHAYLVAQEGVDFFRRIPAFVSFVTGERPLRSILRELERETLAAYDEYVGKEAEIAGEAVAVRAELAQRAANSEGFEDAAMEEPDFASHEYVRFDFSFAKFDRLADRAPEIRFPTLPTDSVDGGRVAEMLNILRGKLRGAQFGQGDFVESQRENARPDLNDIGDRLNDLLERHQHAVRDFDRASRTLPGLALGRLEYFGNNLIREPDLVRPGERPGERLNRTLGILWSATWVVQKAVSGGALDDGEQRRFDATLAALKSQADTLHHELVQRVASAERERESQWWRPILRIFGSSVREVLVRATVGAIFLLGGYLIARATADEAGPAPRTVTITTGR